MLPVWMERLPCKHGRNAVGCYQTVSTLEGEFVLKGRVSDSIPPLSAIEMAVLCDIALGYQSKEIAQRLNRSKPTIETYVRMLCAKLNARSRAHLIARAYDLGILQYHSVESRDFA
jgi:DNA-binding NarL/FixJ family response regulator